MSLDECQTIFVAITLIFSLLAITPVLTSVIQIPKATESFSELWLLDFKHTTENYPFNITLNNSHRVFVGVGNHMGTSSYYMIYVKLRDATQPLPDSNTSTPSPLPPIFEFRLFLANDKTWEAPVDFVFFGSYTQGEDLVPRQISINYVISDLSQPPKRYYQLFFELWIYNATSEAFEYHNRFTSLWLNIIG